jgi:hypothetical protein
MGHPKAFFGIKARPPAYEGKKITSPSRGFEV